MFCYALNGREKKNCHHVSFLKSNGGGRKHVLCPSPETGSRLQGKSTTSSARGAVHICMLPAKFGGSHILSAIFSNYLPPALHFVSNFQTLLADGGLRHCNLPIREQVGRRQCYLPRPSLFLPINICQSHPPFNS